MEKMIHLTINDKDVEIPEGSTILDAARKMNINIPTLCHMDMHGLGFINREANCRVCLVDSGSGKLVPSCNTLVKEGMKIRTDTLQVIRSRRMNVELLLSNHPKDCLVCSANGQCELQSLAASLNIREIRFSGKRIDYDDDASSYSLVRDPNKCILCKRCETMCNEVQTVGTLTDIGRGFPTVVGTAYHLPMIETNCTFCGQCLAVCPTGALTEKSNVEDVYAALNDPERTVLVQTAPAVRVALGEAFGMPVGTDVTGKLATVLRNMGFDYVFDTNFAADLTTMEEAHEFVERFTKKENLPILTSCCPSWVKFIEHNFSDMLNIPSTCKSPHEMFGAVAKTYFAKKMNIDPQKMVVVSVMPCIAKKYESARPELSINQEISDVDLVITTRELAGMIKDFSYDFANLEESDFDDPLGESTGAGAIFGTSGGVSTAALRSAYYMITGEDMEDPEFEELHGFRGIKEATVDIKGSAINIAVASGLGNARTILEQVRNGEKDYQLIEIMACPGGCVDGGGQPYLHGNMDILEKRMEAIHEVDRNKKIRFAHNNPYIQKIYSEFLEHPGSEKAHELLHTKLVKRERLI